MEPNVVMAFFPFNNSISFCAIQYEDTILLNLTKLLLNLSHCDFPYERISLPIHV